MISGSFDGYVTEQPIVKEGQYGRYIEITLRVATAGKEVHYVSSNFFGRKIGPIEEYIHNGSYITMFGCVTSIKEKERSNGGGRYCQIYLKDACYTLPPKMAGEASFRPSLQSGVSEERLDISDFGDDNGDIF
jgi:hypothetical protein